MRPNVMSFRIVPCDGDESYTVVMVGGHVVALIDASAPVSEQLKALESEFQDYKLRHE